MAQIASIKRATREDILRMSVPLFAQRGYEAVSMREIAAAVGIQAPALYYHFPDKQNLYMAVMCYAFQDQLQGPVAALTGDGAPFLRLKRFVATLVEDLTDDPDLLLLLQRERIDGDEARQRLLVDQLFAQPMLAMVGLMQELAPDQDATLLAMSVTGMVLHHLESRPTAHLMPGWKPEHADPALLTRHLCGLLQAMFGVDDEGNPRSRPQA